MANPFRQDYKVRRKKRTALFQIVYIQTGDIFGCTQKPSAPLLDTLNSIYILYICHMLYFL
jgi:prenyltransferase beta subunit